MSLALENPRSEATSVADVKPARASPAAANFMIFEISVLTSGFSV